MKLKEFFSSTSSKLRIGLLGGSFNPAHNGHKYISEEILKRFDLDYIIWLVSPQNPLKEITLINSFFDRLESAKAISKSNLKIMVSDFEKDQDAYYTYITISNLKKISKNHELIWIMGADNMLQFHKWQKWENIIKNIPICIFDRDKFFHKAIRSKLAIKFNVGLVVNMAYNGKLSDYNWYYLKIKANPESSTNIRSKHSGGNNRK